MLLWTSRRCSVKKLIIIIITSSKNIMKKLLILKSVSSFLQYISKLCHSNSVFNAAIGAASWIFKYKWFQFSFWWLIFQPVARTKRHSLCLSVNFWTHFLIWCFAGTERLCDRGHSGGTGVLRLPDNQGLPGLSPGETQAVVGTDHIWKVWSLLGRPVVMLLMFLPSVGRDPSERVRSHPHRRQVPVQAAAPLLSQPPSCCWRRT